MCFYATSIGLLEVIPHVWLSKLVPHPTPKRPIEESLFHSTLSRHNFVCFCLKGVPPRRRHTHPGVLFKLVLFDVAAHISSNVHLVASPVFLNLFWFAAPFLGYRTVWRCSWGQFHQHLFACSRWKAIF